MIVCLSFCIVNTNYKTAEASGLEALLPFVESAAGGLAGLSLGGLIAIVLSMTAVGYGTELAIDKWNDPASQFQAQLKSETNSVVSGWFNRLKDNFVSVKDGVTTLGDVIKKGLDYNIWDFVLPADKNVTVDLPVDIQAYTKAFLEKYTGTKLAPGTYSSNSFVMEEIAKKYNVELYQYCVDNPWKAYKYIILESMDYDSNYGIQHSLSILASNNVFGTDIYQNGYDYFVKATNTDSAFYSAVGSPNYPKPMSLVNGHMNLIKDYKIALSTGCSNLSALTDIRMCFGKILYANCAITYNGVTRPSDETVITIPESGYKFKDTTLGIPKQNALKVNDYLIDTVKDIDLNNVKSTDTVVKAIKDADEVAQANYSNVIATDIAPTKVTDIPDIYGLVDTLPVRIAKSIDLSKGLTDAFSPTANFPSLNNLGAKLGNFFDFTILYEYHEMIETFFTERINNNSPPVFKIYLKQSGFSYYKNLPDSITVINFDFMEKEIFTWGISIRYFIRSLLTFFVVGVWLNRTIKKLPGVVGGS